MQFKIGDQVKVIDYRHECFGKLGTVKEDQEGWQVIDFGNNFAYLSDDQLAPAHTLDWFINTLTSVYEEGEKTADEKWIKALDEKVAALTNQNK